MNKSEGCTAHIQGQFQGDWSKSSRSKLKYNDNNLIVFYFNFQLLKLLFQSKLTCKVWAHLTSECEFNVKMYVEFTNQKHGFCRYNVYFQLTNYKYSNKMSVFKHYLCTQIPARQLSIYRR